MRAKSLFAAALGLVGLGGVLSPQAIEQPSLQAPSGAFGSVRAEPSKKKREKRTHTKAGRRRIVIGYSIRRCRVKYLY
jgi:hypothetical protein